MLIKPLKSHFIIEYKMVKLFHRDSKASLAQIGFAQQSVHPTCGILRDLQAFFWLRAFSTSQTLSTPAHTRVTQTVRQPKCKTKTISEAQVWIWDEDNSGGGFQIIKIYPRFDSGSFQISILISYFFSKQVFKFSSFSFGSTFSAGIISVWLCRVAEIGFKVFGLRFGWRWFWWVVSVFVGCVPGWFCVVLKIGLSFFGIGSG